jgi:uncharacterized tellurite resistance protein B-like protein
MEQNLNHFANLVSLAYADNYLHPEELAYLYKVAKRLKIEDSVVQEFIKKPPVKDYDLPKDEVRRYIFLDDLLNLIAVDGEIHDNEIEKSKSLANKLGFDELIIDSIISKIKIHIKNGFDKNTSSEIIKFDIYSLTQTTEKYEKYNK